MTPKVNFTFKKIINRVDPKLYVGGLSPNTTRALLKEYFEQYGKCTEVIIMMDKSSSNFQKK